MRALPILSVLAATMAAAISASSAGTVSLRWDPSAGASGYRVFYGNAAGSYSGQHEAGNTTQATISGLADCTTWYFAVKAYDSLGNLSETYSNEVSGWPRPTVTSVSPIAAEQGSRLTLTIDGANFKSGAAVTFSTSGLTVNAIGVQSCNRLTADVTIGASAAAGNSDVEVMNTDRTFGVRAAGLQIAAAVAPTVNGATPADGASGVSVSVQPTVTFSEPVLAASVLVGSVRLLDDSGAAVAQAGGSPSLSTDGRTATIRPAAALALGETYRIQVVGGSSGIRDLGGLAMVSTWVQATGFTTAADTTGPTISAVAANNLTSSSARIVWTTSEPADGQVFYRKSGDTTYQQTAVDSAMTTSHTVNLSGLLAGTAYQFHVRSADAAANATVNADATFTTLQASTGNSVQAELEDGLITSPVRMVAGAGAFDGAWVDTPSGGATGTETAPTGTVSLDVYVPTAGSWTLWVRLYAPSLTADSWFESVDGGSRQTVVAPSVGSWGWAEGRTYTLTAGLHRIELGGRESTTRADRVLLTDDGAFVPTSAPGSDTLSPLPPATFTISPGSASNTLNWKASSSTDHARTVIRYRTDGQYPRTPVDGLPLVDQPGAPNSNGSFTHTGLANGTTYRYAAFSLDASANGSNPKNGSGTPGSGNGKPGKVNNNRRK